MVQPWLELSDLENPSDPYAEYAINSASFILWALSGRKYHGVTQVTEQYVCPEYDVPEGCSWDSDTHFYNVQGYSGYVVPNYLLPNYQKFGLRFRLRHQPVRKIYAVSIDGSLLPSSSYVLRNNSELVINDASATSLCAGPQVTYAYGVNPPDIGHLAAVEMANEYVKFFNHEACALPDRVTSVSRQGLTIEVYDPADFLDKGRIGLPLADVFIASTNPFKSQKPARVLSVDMPRGFTQK